MLHGAGGARTPHLQSFVWLLIIIPGSQTVKPPGNDLAHAESREGLQPERVVLVAGEGHEGIPAPVSRWRVSVGVHRACAWTSI